MLFVRVFTVILHIRLLCVDSTYLKEHVWACSPDKLGTCVRHVSYTPSAVERSLIELQSVSVSF